MAFPNVMSHLTATNSPNSSRGQQAFSFHADSNLAAKVHVGPIP